MEPLATVAPRDLADHGTSRFEEQIHVLIVATPERVRQRVPQPVSTVDIAATLSSRVDLAWAVPASQVLWAARRWDKPSIARLSDVLEGRLESGVADSERKLALQLMARGPQETHRKALARIFRNDLDPNLRHRAPISLAQPGDAAATSMLPSVIARASPHGSKPSSASGRRQRLARKGTPP
jgi:hypothetical protein